MHAKTDNFGKDHWENFESGHHEKQPMKIDKIANRKPLQRLFCGPRAFSAHWSVLISTYNTPNDQNLTENDDFEEDQWENFEPGLNESQPMQIDKIKQN